ncbi:hypothetical protein RD110_04000 [Rhodoferax koreense]|uniref:HIT domain-containing protein n=1 Tax=Rhodoferax koreensis TaxID=1842727 RepID=A0A1P8JRS3_9BURK|nr:HIT domain-containing protein [Rhodoferax koreense]APW36467.1 hypothetical protein RD110_04000 [Rhodoferax koreense]
MAVEAVAACRYCTATNEELAPVMAHIADLDWTRVFLYGDQTHRGRCVVLFKRHARELFELSEEERAGFIREVALVAAAIAKAVPCDKLNYAGYGDRADHLHFHVVPKTQDGPAWGQPFILNAETPVLLDAPDQQEMLLKLKQFLQST